MDSSLPRIEISLSQIRENTQILTDLYLGKGISLMGVTKAVLGEPAIAKAMIEGGAKFIADSRIENILKMKKAGISTPFVLLRTLLSQAESIVENVDISLNTEIETIKKLSHDMATGNFASMPAPYRLKKEPANRLPLGEALTHPWLREFAQEGSSGGHSPVAHGGA